jgi:alpha-L-arabinofuranosidase
MSLTKYSIMKKFFFLSLITFFSALTPAQTPINKIVVHADQGKDTISRYIYGQFAEHLGHCIYEGIWVGKNSPIPNTRGMRNDIIKALKEIHVPVLRWPGGCFADTYHWKDGVGPAEDRPTIVNTTWGGVVEDNSFGTHEFLDFCELIGTEPYLAINVGSGTVQEAREWVEYVNADNESPMVKLRKKNGREKPWNVKFWGIGNESWGCGGNMTPDYYADHYKQFATFNAAPYKVASGGINIEWTETLMKKMSGYQQLIQGYSFHHYTITHDWSYKGSATDFTKDEWFKTLKGTFDTEEALKNEIAVMDKYDPKKKIGLIADEWGDWFDVETGTNPAFLYQQNTLRDALSAGIYMNIFNNHCDRVKMANIAQLVNVLQAMVLTKDKSIVLTPTYYVFKMFMPHQDALLLPVDLTCGDYSDGSEKIPIISASASKDSNGKIHITLVNVDPDNSRNVECDISGMKASKVTGTVLTAKEMNSYNDFGKPESITIQNFTGVHLRNGMVTATLPAKSVVVIEVN